MKPMYLPLIAVLCLGGPGPGSGKDKPDQLRSAFMKLKLRNAEMVLSGIALHNFESIQEGADNLILLSRKAQFQLGEMPGYTLQRQAFQRAAERIARSARAKNLDSAALAYVDLTLRCVSCHKHVRSNR